MLTKEEVKIKIAQGEGLNVEFKTAFETLPRNVFETICAFLNRKGGYIFLGVKDNGKIEGVDEDAIPAMLKILANDVNNMQILMPTAFVEAEVFEIENKKIICIYVSESSQAHSHKGFYYDRREEGDYRLTTHHLISGLYLRKQDVYSENRVFPQLKITDFVAEDFDTVDCNLLQAYERLMSFIRKHTPDRFYLESDVRISIRDIIFREMITNMLNIMGRITPQNLKSHTKNPTIFAFFKQLHWVEDLGSGVRNMYKYCPVYMKDTEPVMEEDDIFRQTVRYDKDKPDIKQDTTNAEKLLVLLRENPKITTKEMAETALLSLRTIYNIMTELKNDGIVERHGSKKDGKWIVKDIEKFTL